MRYLIVIHIANIIEAICIHHIASHRTLYDIYVHLYKNACRPLTAFWFFLRIPNDLCFPFKSISGPLSNMEPYTHTPGAHLPTPNLTFRAGKLLLVGTGKETQNKFFKRAKKSFAGFST